MKVYQVACRIDAPNVSGPGYNVFNVSSTEPEGIWAHTAAIITKIDNFYTAWNSYRGASANLLVGYTVRGITPGQPVEIIPSLPPTHTAGGGTQLPSQLAAVISWRTALAGIRYRGRTYCGPLSGTALTGADLTPAFVTALQNAAMNLISDILAIAPGLSLCVYSRRYELMTPITSAAVNNKVDTLRRRH